MTTDLIGSFAQNIINHKYAFKNAEGQPVETWADISQRVAFSVLDGAAEVIEARDSE